MKGRRVVNVAGERTGSLTYGIHAVREHLLAHPERVVQVWLAEDGSSRRAELARLASASSVPVSHLSPEQLVRLSGVEHHQGAVAALRAFAYVPLFELVARKPQFLVAADGIEDPRNLGALIRSVAAAGASGLVIPRDRAAQVTPAAEKASAGVAAWFPVCQVTNLARSVRELKRKAQFWVIGLSQLGDSTIFATRIPLPVLLVVGGETGLRPLVQRSCDLLLRIPMAAGVESLNVAVAAAVAAFEIGKCLSAKEDGQQTDSDGILTR